MALEDAVCVGRLIGAPVRAGAALGPALAAFDHTRRPWGQRTVRSATAMARIGADLGPGWRQTVRNTALRLAPGGLMVRVGSSVTGWTPPAVPHPDRNT